MNEDDRERLLPPTLAEEGSCTVTTSAVVNDDLDDRADLAETCSVARTSQHQLRWEMSEQLMLERTPAVSSPPSPPSLRLGVFTKKSDELMLKESVKTWEAEHHRSARGQHTWQELTAVSQRQRGTRERGVLEVQQLSTEEGASWTASSWSYCWNDGG
jgi:hypothetical protein